MVQTTFSCRYAAIHLVYHPFYTSAEKGFDEGETFRSLGHIRTEFGMAFRLQAWLQSK